MKYQIPEFLKRRPRTRIICTIGPTTGSVESIIGLIEAGMSVARLNLAHGTFDVHRKYVQAIRDATRNKGASIGILADLPGPKYRLGMVEGDPVKLSEGDTFTLVSGGTGAGNRDSAVVLPAGIHNDLHVGAHVLIDDGAIRLRVNHIAGKEASCIILSGGTLKSRKAVAALGCVSTLEYFTNETRSALDFAVEQRVDYVGLSYVRSDRDVLRTRSILAKSEVRPQLIAKIELRQAVENIGSILQIADGVMVARGDLGVELPIAEVPGVQKQIIRAANHAGKVVITATQMLESMIDSPMPTRAEATDIHNAVKDGTDAVMLSAETSIGKYALEATQCMAQVADKAEEELNHNRFIEERHSANLRSDVVVDDAIAYSAVRVADAVGAKLIIAFTESGSTAGRVASFRPKTPVLGMVGDPAAERRLTLRWGVQSLRAPTFASVQEMFVQGSKAALDAGYCKKGDLAIVVVGMPIGVPGNTNLLRVIRVPE